MLDIKFIRENKKLLEKVCQAKNIKIDLDRLLDLDEKRRALIQQAESMRAEQKKLGKNDLKKARELKEKARPLAEELIDVESAYNDLMYQVPNIYDSATPVAKDDSGNKEIEKWGEPTKFDFKPKSHVELGESLDLIDFERGVKTSGFRGYYLKNEAVLLHFAMLWHALLKMVSKGFMPMLTPTIVREFVLVGSGHFPFGKDEVYQIANPGKLADGETIKDPAYLAGTSEPSLLAYFADSVLAEKDLPVKVCGFSPCYRSEVGSYGKDAKGLYRLHEFMKVEQIVFCQADIQESNKWLDQMCQYSREILEELKLPYRVLQICTGDMGAGKYKMYDLETWMPSRNAYGETHSDSNLTDWQTRRLNIKYKTQDGEKKFAFALNNTVLASPRILIAVLENYQQADGGVLVPEVLQKYLPFKEIRAKK